MTDMDVLWQVYLPGEKWPRDSVFAPVNLEGEALRAWVKRQKEFRYLPRDFELRAAAGQEMARDIAIVREQE